MLFPLPTRPPPHLLLRKLEVWPLSFCVLSSLLVPTAHIRGTCFTQRLLSRVTLRFESSTFNSSVLGSQIFTHNAHFLRHAGDQTRGPMHSRQTFYQLGTPPSPLLFPPEPGLLCSRQHLLLRLQGSGETTTHSQVFQLRLECDGRLGRGQVWLPSAESGTHRDTAGVSLSVCMVPRVA